MLRAMPKPLLTLKNTLQEVRLFQRRIIVASLIVIILAFILITRLFYLQIIDYKVYTNMAQQNQLTMLPIEPKRGLIFDRNGVLIADDRPVFSIDLIPEFVPNIKQTIHDLIPVVDLNQDDIDSFYKQLAQTHALHSLPLKINLSEEEIARFSVNQYRFPGVYIRTRLIRNYPMGLTFAHVLGYVARINATELAHLSDSVYTPSDDIGKLGIEKYYEKLLRGQFGYEQVETDASGHVVRVMRKIEPVAGDSLYLTLDSRLQLAAMNALGSNRGAVVAIDPRNGQVLALVSTPSFDPNPFVNGISATLYHQLQDSPDRPLYNRAIRGQYPMASTIKPFLAITGLATNTIKPSDTIRDPGYFVIPGSTHHYRDWVKYGHGIVDVSKAITQSCDTFFYNLAYHMGIDKIDAYLPQFGFGKATGIDMPDELHGNVASPSWKQRVLHKPWFIGDTVNSGIGQGFMLTTPLQSAAAVATIAAHGRHYQPYLLLKVIQSNGQQQVTKPILTNTVTASAAVWQVVIPAMQAVTSSPRERLIIPLPVTQPILVLEKQAPHKYLA
jgi:penicillin-binding protein 2